MVKAVYNNEVEKFLGDWLALAPEKLYDDCLLESELGVTGDDALELMEALVRRYHINTQGFDFSLHFAPEVGYATNRQYGYYPITVGHLKQVAQTRRWILPEKNLTHFASARARLKRSRTAYFFSLVMIAAVIWLLHTSTSAETLV